MASGVQEAVDSPAVALQDASDLRPLRIDVSPSPESFESSERGVKRKRREEAALFLEKTYEMLERCPSNLACWTVSGESFVVKQPKTFAEHVIPTYFKHRKFSSFVRQLNLYGFRKIRTTSEEGEASPKEWWEFHHDQFVRGKRELLCEIRRRSTNDRVGTPVDRVEFEELRAEVGGLRDEMHKLQSTNQQLLGMLQMLLQRREKDGGGVSQVADVGGYTTSPSMHRSLPSISLPSPTAHTTGPQLALLQLRQGLGTPSQQTPRTPASSFQLRPVQSLMVNLSPCSRPTPSPRPNQSYVGTPSYSQQQQEQLMRNQQCYYQNTPVNQPSPTANHSPIKRLRVNSTTSMSGVHSPEDAAVRELSRVASEIRVELLACITARVTGFLRVHRDQTGPTREADADIVAEAVGSDIRQQLALLQSSTSTSDPMLLDAETTCMYRVEILKFISRELPRAVQDAVDKRLPAPEKLKQRPAKDRSLLALLVQKAQKALEYQMHSETAAVRR